jgi:hypothetical protein
MNPPPLGLPATLVYTGSLTLKEGGIVLAWDGSAWVGTATVGPLRMGDS